MTNTNNTLKRSLRHGGIQGRYHSESKTAWLRRIGAIDWNCFSHGPANPVGTVELVVAANENGPFILGSDWEKYATVTNKWATFAVTPAEAAELMQQH